MFDIPGSDNFKNILPLDKGYSGDKKYYIETSDARRLLLRVSDIKEYDRRKTMFEMMTQLAPLNLPMPQPLDFGTCDGGKSVYQLLSWCDGEDLEKILPTLSESEQYAVGLEFGRILKKVHSLGAPDTLDDWFLRYTAQNDARVNAFAKTGIEIEGSDVLLRYYTENKGLLRNRPQCFQHGDSHIGNLLLDKQKKLSVIDWEIISYENYGDPWEEFNRINHSEIVPHFHSAQIAGYFDGEPPEDFWKLLALYLSAGALMIVVWAHHLQPNELEYAIQNVSNVLSWFDNMNALVPSWYVRN